MLKQPSPAPDRPLHLFVDNSNVLIEGRRFSEMARKGRDKPGSGLDKSYEIDWGKFLYVVKENDSRPLAQVPILYGSRPPPDDTVWQRIRDEGFDTKIFDRNIRNKEKGVDMELGMDIAERIHTAAAVTTIALAAGDADYVPAIERAKSKGWRVEVWFWSNASSDIKASADKFVELDKYLQYLKLHGKVAFPP